MGFVESMIKNHPEYERRQNVLARIREREDNMKHRVPNEPWSTEEIEDAVDLAEGGPIPGRPSVTRGAGDGRTRSRAVPDYWGNIANDEILTQASKEMKKLGIGWWDTVNNDKELQATVDYIRNAGKDDDDDYVPEPEPVRNEESYEAPEEVLAAKAGIDDYRASMEDGSFFKQILGPRASGDPDKSWSELQDQDEEFKNPETFIVDRGRDKAGGSYLDNYLLNEKHALKEELLKELLA